jgi:hypothetical protein
MAKYMFGYFCWTKAIGPLHLAKGYNTLCGKPMLGNNYTERRRNLSICPKCLDKVENYHDPEDER